MSVDNYNDNCDQKNMHDVLSAISKELGMIAQEIETTLELDSQILSDDDIMRIQKIDFCSQKLQDFSVLLEGLIKNDATLKDKALHQSFDALKLEYTKSLLKA